MATVINTKPCSRCGGSGQYSFNYMDGTKCYGCGGTGKVATAPKGQKKIKPTCEDYRRANTGDIVEIGCVLYQVGEIRWIAPLQKGYELLNQRMELTRLVDEKEFVQRRSFHGYDPTCGWWQRVDCGPRQTPCTAIYTPDELVGTVYIPGQYGKENIVTLPDGVDYPR